jgi:hypothetical protein
VRGERTTKEDAEEVESESNQILPLEAALNQLYQVCAYLGYKYQVESNTSAHELTLAFTGPDQE